MNHRMTRIAFWIVRLFLGPTAAESVIGDLEEERKSKRRSRVWLLREAVRVACRCLFDVRIWACDSLQDVRFAWRMLAKAPAFTVLVVLTLAIGIGANNTAFMLGNAVLLNDIPFDEPDRLVSIDSRDARNRSRRLSYADYRDWRDGARAFADIGAYRNASMNVGDEEQAPERFLGSYVSANTFRLVGAQPVLGRDFLPEDDQAGAQAVVILGYSVWANRYGSDPSVIGQTIRVNGVPVIIIGVMPAGFKFPVTNELWQPLAQMPDLNDRRDVRVLEAFGRLTSGVGIAEAQAGLTAIAARLARDFPDTNAGVEPTVVPFIERYLGPQLFFIFRAFMAGAGFVLLIACANIANLLLVRAGHRAREISVRVSIGATRWRIVRQLLTESLLLAAAAGFVGIWLSMLGVQAFEAAVQNFGRPYWLEFTFDLDVFIFLAVVCFSTAVIFGLTPALHISKAKLNEVLKEGGRSGTGSIRLRRWSSALVVTEIVLTLITLAGAAYWTRSFLALYLMDPGFDTSNLTTMSLDLPQRQYATPERRRAFYTQLEERFLTHPAISSATIASAVPFGGGSFRELAIHGRPTIVGDPAPIVSAVTVGSRYFETLGVPLLQGRAFTDTDGMPGYENAVVNQRFVEMHFRHEQPVGRRIRLTNLNIPDETAPWITIAGVSPTIRQANADDLDPDPVLYLPYRLSPPSVMTLMVRSPHDASQIASLLREEVRNLDPDLPLFDIATMEQRLANSRWPQRVFGSMFAISAAIALLLAGVGLYATTSHAAAQRTREIGVRMALGAQQRQVLWLILRRTVLHLAIGLPIGMAGVIAVGKSFESMLGRPTNDVATLTSIALLLVLVSFVACILPARRAGRADPVAALRHE